MLTASRTVRRLRLRASSDGAVRRAVVLLEDALRTASLPDAAGRIVIVRKLALGCIHGSAAPQAIAVRLERAFERLAPQCVYAGSPGASAAPAVWFRDALDAHTRLALRLAAGDGAEAWYWTLAVKAWQPGTPLPQALREIMFSLASLPEARTALPQWTRAMSRSGYIERVVDALRIEDMPRLAQAAGLRMSTLPRSLRSTNDPRRLDDADAPLSTRTRPAAAAMGAGIPGGFPGQAEVDLRLQFLQALVVAAGDGADGARCEVIPPAIGPSQTLHGPVPRTRGTTVSASRNPDDSAAMGPEARSAPERALDAQASSAPIAHKDNDAISRDSTLLASHLPWVAPDSLTRAGGLLFLIPVLARLGYPQWLDAHPVHARSNMAQHVLAAVLARLRVVPEDPAWQLTLPCGGDGRTQRRGESLGQAWVAAARRWLRRRARIGLADLVLRPAILSLTPTHADMEFETSACDLRIRRSGLDLDPGWVPWLGRVVTFHYR